MKLRLEQISAGQDEVIIRYLKMTAQIEQLVDLCHKIKQRCWGLLKMGRAMFAWMISSTLRVLAVEPLLIRTRGSIR